MKTFRARRIVFFTIFAAFLPWLILTRQSAAEPVAVKIGLAAFGTNSMPYFLAKEQGFYREKGLQVDFVLMPGAVAAKATVSGEIEFNGVAPSSVGAAMQGARLKVVLVLSRKPKYWIFGKPELQTIADLAGRTLASGTTGGDLHIQTLILLERLGLAGKVRVVPVPTAGPQASFQLMTTGQVDAAYANESTYFAFQRLGYRELINYADHVESLSGLAASQRLIDAKPDLVQAFVDASYRGMLFFKERRPQSVAMMVRTMKLDAKSAERIYDLVISTFGGDGTAPYRDLKSQLEARQNILGLAGRVPPYEELFDDRFARRAAAAGIRVQ